MSEAAALSLHPTTLPVLPAFPGWPGLDKAAEPEYDYFAIQAANVKAKLAEDWDYLTVTTGYEGSGKSTLALKWGLLTDSSRAGFSARKVAADVDRFLHLLEEVEDGSALVLDEGALGGMAAEHMTEVNRALVKATTVVRARNFSLAVVIPHKRLLTMYLREHRVRCWWDVVRRGEVIAHFPTRNRYSDDPTWWERTYRHRYDPIPEDDPLWVEYLKVKAAGRAKALAREEKPTAGGRAAAKDERDQRLKDLAHEVAANGTFWTGGKRGFCRTAKLELELGLSEREAKRVAHLAKVLRSE